MLFRSTFAGTLVGGILPGVAARVTAPHLPVATALEQPEPYAWAILIGALFGLTSIIPLTRVRGGLRPVVTQTEHHPRGAFPFALVASLVIYVVTRHMGWTTCQAYCSPYMDTDLALSTSSIGTLTSIGQIAAIGATLMLPRIVKHHSHAWVLIVSTAMQIVSLALLAFVPHWATASLGLLGVQVSAGIWIPELQVFQMELVKESWRSLAYGAVAMAMGLGFGSMSFFGGRLIDRQGYSPLFTIGTVLTAVSTLLMLGIAHWSVDGSTSDTQHIEPTSHSSAARQEADI